MIVSVQNIIEVDIASKLLKHSTDEVTSYQGSDDPDNPSHLAHFLVDQLGLIHKLNCLNMTWISYFH